MKHKRPVISGTVTHTLKKDRIKKIAKAVIIVAAVVIATIVLFSAMNAVVNATGHDPSLIETRYCGEPKRNLNGEIIRRSAVRDAFQRIHPCPSNGNTSGPCAGWQIDHVLPLADGFCDSVQNLQWLPVILKTGRGTLPKDRWERKINGTPMILVPMPLGPLSLSVGP